MLLTRDVKKVGGRVPRSKKVGDAVPPRPRPTTPLVLGRIECMTIVTDVPMAWCVCQPLRVQVVSVVLKPLDGSRSCLVGDSGRGPKEHSTPCPNKNRTLCFVGFNFVINQKNQCVFDLASALLRNVQNSSLLAGTSQIG